MRGYVRFDRLDRDRGFATRQYFQVYGVLLWRRTRHFGWTSAVFMKRLSPRLCFEQSFTTTRNACVGGELHYIVADPH